RSHPNVAAVIRANKTARMAWAMIRNGTDYQPNRVRSRAPKSADRIITVQGGAFHPRLQSDPNDGEQIEPAPAEPENVHVRAARQSNRERVRE
ncbi:MAG: hypothetical protein V3R62_10500, partial [Acidiferrobacterales bacterium]